MTADRRHRDPVTWALAIQAEYERAEAADDQFRDENIARALEAS